MGKICESPNPLQDHLDKVVNVSWNFAKRINTAEGHQQNAMVGLASEAAEALDNGKKMWFHTEKPFEFHRPKLVSELGDVAFYLVKTLDVLGITLEEILADNKAKLESRHPELGKVTERFQEGYIK